MATRKVASGRSVRRSVTISAKLDSAVKGFAKRHRVSIGGALVSLAERGIEAEKEARRQLRAAHARFLEETEPDQKSEAGRDLIRSIFGKDSIAEDSVWAACDTR